MIIVTCAIIEAENKVLCAQRSAAMDLPFKWEFPGGKVEEDENLEACLKREIKEELGVEIEILEQLPSTHHAYPTKKLELIPFRCSLKSFDIQLQEHERVEWVPVSQLKALDWAEADIPIVEYYMKKYGVK